MLTLNLTRFSNLFSESLTHKRTLWPVLLIVLVTLSVYSQVLHHDFVNFDDDGYVYNNYHVRSGLSMRGFIYAFTTTDKGNWIPLTWLSHMLDVQISGLNPGAHHLTNLLLHVFNSLLLFIFLKNYTKKPWPAFIVAMLFAVHPLHVESVAWISERKDVLSTFFGLSALIMYCRYAWQHDFKSYLSAFLFFLAGLLSKPMLVTLPIVIILLDFWPLHRIPSLRIFNYLNENRILLFEKIPFLLLSVIFGVITIWSQKTSKALASSTGIPFLIRLMNAAVSYAKYLYKTIWPFDLAVIYPYQKDIDILPVAMSGLLLLSISGFVIFFNKKHPYLLVGWLWFLITLLPVIGLIQVGTQAMADRYTYIPLIGLFIGSVWGMHSLILRFQVNRSVVNMAAVALILTFSMITLNQLKTWKNSYTLFRHALSVTSNNWVAHLNFGEILFERGKIDAAIEHYKKAVKINPSFELAYLNLGTAVARKGQIDNSIKYYQQALAINNNMPTARLNLGNAYFRKGMLNKALLQYAKALELKPDFPEAYCGVGAVMAKRGNLPAATGAFKKALEIDPRSRAALEKIKQVEKFTIQAGDRSPVPR